MKDKKIEDEGVVYYPGMEAEMKKNNISIKENHEKMEDLEEVEHTSMELDKKGIVEIKLEDCYSCPFLADTYTVSYKEVDDASSYCTFYDERIGGEMGDDSMYEDLEDDDIDEHIKPFPDFCKVREITIKK